MKLHQLNARVWVNLFKKKGKCNLLTVVVASINVYKLLEVVSSFIMYSQSFLNFCGIKINNTLKLITVLC